MPEIDEAKLNKARALAKTFHKEHFRVSGESYYDHSKKVAKELIRLGIKDTDLLVTAYLHHILEFDPNYLNTIKLEFGDRAGTMSEHYINIPSIELPVTQDYNKSILIQTFFNLVKDPEILLLRLADKTEDIKTAHHFDKETAEVIAEKSLKLYSPICKLMGLSSFVPVLEENAMKILNPKDYYTIQYYLKKNKNRIEKDLQDTKKVLSDLLREQGIEHEITYRVKHIYSIFKKFKSKYYDKVLNEKSLKKISDLAAMRILVSKVGDCYTVESMIRNLFEFDDTERDDYILNPKPSGYKSIHDVVKTSSNFELEIQIRTFEMHEYNEYGIASHAFYKLGESLEKEYKKNPDILKELDYNIGDTVKIDQFSDYVYVFTPKGDIKQFKKGANLIDFAYDIHAELGNSCIGGIVNGNFQKVTYELQDGDRVEIKTSGAKKRPSPDWYDLATTKKAKTHIRRAQQRFVQEE